MKSYLLNSTAAFAPPSDGGTSAGHDETFLTSRQVAARYGVSVRSIDRWTNRPPSRDGDRAGENDSDGADFPQPIMLNRRHYWRLSDLVAWERRAAVNAVANRRERAERLAAATAEATTTA